MIKECEGSMSNTTKIHKWLDKHDYYILDSTGQVKVTYKTVGYPPEVAEWDYCKQKATSESFVHKLQQT